MDEEESAKVSILGPYITSLVADIAAARKSEDVKKGYENLIQAEKRTLALEKFACETCLVWWCLVTRKPSIYALGTDMKAFGFVAEMIAKQWFPSGAPGRTSTDWETKEKERKEKGQLKHRKKSESEIHMESQRKLKPEVVKGADGSEKIVWVVQEEPVAKIEAAELALIQTYTIKIENHVKEFVRKLTSVDGERLSREVLVKVGLPIYPAGWHPQAADVVVDS